MRDYTVLGKKTGRLELRGLEEGMGKVRKSSDNKDEKQSQALKQNVYERQEEQVKKKQKTMYMKINVHTLVF